jgi:acyl-CoA-binding protein
MSDSGSDTSCSGGSSGGDAQFHAAADHLGQLVTAHPTSVPDQIKLQLYGLYKQATAGSCSAPKPPFWQRAARLKWCVRRRAACVGVSGL